MNNLTGYAAAQHFVDTVNAYDEVPYHFSVDPGGRKYIRIVVEGKNDVIPQRHVHCFIEAATGAVLKADGWKAPAKGVRFATVDDALAVFAKNPYRASFGGYLYAR